MPSKPSFTPSEYFESIVNNSKQNALLFINEAGIITGLNNSFTINFGYSNEDLTGVSAQKLFTDEDKKIGRFENELYTVLTRGQAQDNNYIVHKSGEYIWASGESIRVTNSEGDISILKIIQNIQEKKLADDSVINLSDINERILSSIEDAVCVVDENMTIIKSNGAFERLFQKNAGSVSFADMIKERDNNDDLFNKINYCISSREAIFHNEIEIKTVSGDKKIFQVSGKAIENTGSKNNVLIAAHDITLQKQVGREREDIIGFIAHELRNPLANILLCNELMSQFLEENNIPESVNMLTRSQNNVLRLNKMIGELYDATKVSAGNIRLEISEFNFGEMIKEAIETVAILQPDYNLAIKGDGNISVTGDRYRLIQVITNYLTNGIKYSSGNPDVNLSIYHDEKNITVSVSDKGSGIPKNQIPYIFERFFRAEKTKNLEGIGLGLYLCRQIILAHNGNVWVESEEGKGSVFYFSIPLTYLQS